MNQAKPAKPDINAVHNYCFNFGLAIKYTKLRRDTWVTGLEDKGMKKHEEISVDKACSINNL